MAKQNRFETVVELPKPAKEVVNVGDAKPVWTRAVVQPLIERINKVADRCGNRDEGGDPRCKD